MGTLRISEYPLHDGRVQEERRQGHPGTGPGGRIQDLNLEMSCGRGAKEIRQPERGDDPLTPAQQAQGTRRMEGGEQLDGGRIVHAPDRQPGLVAEGVGSFAVRQDGQHHRGAGRYQELAGNKGQTGRRPLGDDPNGAHLGARGQNLNGLQRQVATVLELEFALKIRAGLSRERSLGGLEGPSVAVPVAPEEDHAAQHTFGSLAEMVPRKEDRSLSLMGLHVIHDR